MSREELWCPVCETMQPHDRGYLKEHYTSVIRGALNTGKKVLCDGSNRKPAQDLRTVTFTGMCTNCVTTVRREFTETYPGSLDKYGGVVIVNCPECGDEGDYCKKCDHSLHQIEQQAPAPDGTFETDDIMDKLLNGGTPTDEEALALINGAYDRAAQLDAGDDPYNVTVKVWIDGLDEAECSDGGPHEPYHRERQDRPVTLTDNHVIKEPVGEDE